jgi:hypothetical protein
MDSQGVWVPVPVRGKLNVRITNLRGNSPDDLRGYLGVGDGHDAHALRTPIGSNRQSLREHHEINCGTRQCRNKVAADNSHLQFLFALIPSAIRDAYTPARREWVYLLADLATADESRGTITLTMEGLKAALAYNNVKFTRRAER